MEIVSNNSTCFLIWIKIYRKNEFSPIVLKWNVNIRMTNEVVIDTNRLIVGIPKCINIECTIQLNNNPHSH